jgi:FtsZ-binding cell division protein ZapB
MDPSQSTSTMTDQQRDLEFHIAGLAAEAAESRARLAHLERVMQDAQHVAAQFRDENDHLKTELQRTQGALQTLSGQQKQETLKVKPRKPEAFHGNRSEDVEGFLVTLERYLRLSAVPTARWVDFSASFLRHQADKWFRVQLSTHGENSQFATHYQTFKTEFLKQFKPVNAVLTARDKISKLKQTTSAIAYTHQFLSLKLEIPDMSDAEARDRYMRGLKPKVNTKVRLENKNTLNEMIQVAQRYDEAVFSSRQASTSTTKDPNAMDIDALDMDDSESSDEEEDEDEDKNALNMIAKNKKRFIRPRFKKSFRPKTKARNESTTTHQTKAQCLAQGLCFKCKKAGHRIRDCPEWKTLKVKAQ